MDQELVRRIAQALREARRDCVGHAPGGEAIEIGGAVDIAELARAVVLALREPTDAMRAAGSWVAVKHVWGRYEYVDEDSAERVFRAMCDAALGVPPERDA